MANRSSWDESAAGDGPFDRAAVAPLFDALRDPLEEVRTGALRALVRLPLADAVWLELGDFIGPVLAAPTDDAAASAGIPRLELIQAAIYVPMRPMRELLQRLADEGAADERAEAARALARVSAAAKAAWVEAEPVAETLELALPPAERARLQEQALMVAAPWLEASPAEPALAAEPKLPPQDGWQLLAHLPPETATRLISALFAHLARQVSAGNHRKVLKFGNQVMLLPDNFWAKLAPDVPALVASYAVLREHRAWGLADQLAWVVARAGLGRLVAELPALLPAADDAERPAIVSLLERAICYARWSHKPLFGDSAGAGDVPPPAEAPLELGGLESAEPKGLGDDEAFAAPGGDEGLSLGLPGVDDEPVVPPDARRIQGKVFELGPAGPHGAAVETLEGRAFRAGGEYRLDAWIGPLEAGAIAARAAFPEDELPPDLASYDLTILFWEIQPVPRLQTGSITLPRGAGKSTVCPFRFTVDAGLSNFEARVQVLYGARTLQTVILAGPVVPDPAAAPAGAEIAFLLDTPVRSTAAGLEKAPGRAAALMVDTPAGGSPHITVAAGKRVELHSLAGLDTTIKMMRARLEQIADDPDAFKTLDDKATHDLLRFFARQGSQLYRALIQQQLAGFPLDEALPIQLVSARDSFLPLEFVYDRPAPAPDATLCPGAAEALAKGTCPTCESATPEEARKHVCPLGFWCMRRVIERHAVRPVAEAGLAGADYALAADPVDGRNALSLLSSAVYATSARVKGHDAQALAASLATATGGRAAHVKDWTAWRAAVKQGASMLVLLPHTLRDADEIPTLEIGEELLAEIDISPEVVLGAAGNTPPVVLLLGCDTAVLDIPYQNFATQFRSSGAAIVLNTLAPVLGRHVVPVAQMLVEELRRAAAAGGSFGAALVAVRRRGLAAGLPVVLSLVAYGDADWGIRG